MCNHWNPICDAGEVLGSVGSHVAGSVFSEVAKAFSSAAAKVTGWMWTVIAQTTAVDLSGGWVHSILGITATLAGVVIVAIFVLELIKAVLRREPASLTRAVVGVGAGILGAAASIGVVEALLAATDALCDGIVKTAGLGSIAHLGSKVAPAAAITGIGSPALVLILGLGYVLAAFLVWAVFIIRKAMIIVAAVFAPVAFAGAAAHATSGWVRKWIEFTLAMVFSKLVVVIMFTLAVSLVGSPGSGMAAVGSLFSGLAMMLIACFAPWMLLRLVHFIGGDLAAAHQHGTQQAVLAAGSTPLAMARSGASKVAGVIGAPAAGGAAAGAGAGAAASRAFAQPAAGGAANSTAGGAGSMAGAGKSLANNPVIKGNEDGGAQGEATGGGLPPTSPTGGPGGGTRSHAGGTGSPTPPDAPASEAPPAAPSPPTAPQPIPPPPSADPSNGGRPGRGPGFRPQSAPLPANP